MTPAEIAAHLLAQTALTEETMEPLHAYKREKRASGAPVDLEYAILDAARVCEDVRVALESYLVCAEKEVREGLAAVRLAGVRLGSQTWFFLDGRRSAEALHDRMVVARNQFVALVEAWAAVADRIVATDEDRARVAAETRARAIASLATKPARELRAMAKQRGLDVGTDRREIAAALVDAGVTG